MSNNKKLKQLADSFIDFRRHSQEISKGTAVYNNIVLAISKLLDNPNICAREIEKIFCEYATDNKDDNCFQCTEDCCADLVVEIQNYVSFKREEIKHTLLQDGLEETMADDYMFSDSIALDQLSTYLPA